MVLHTPSLGRKNRRPRQNFRPRLPRDTVLVNTRFIRSQAGFSSTGRDADESVTSALAEFLRCESVVNRPTRALPNVCYLLPPRGHLRNLRGKLFWQRKVFWARTFMKRP